MREHTSVTMVVIERVAGCIIIIKGATRTCKSKEKVIIIKVLFMVWVLGRIAKSL